jgi:hypothetical protein
MKYIFLSVVLLGFFGLIGFAVWWTGSGYPLFALLLLVVFSGIEIGVER